MFSLISCELPQFPLVNQFVFYHNMLSLHISIGIVCAWLTTAQGTCDEISMLQAVSQSAPVPIVDPPNIFIEPEDPVCCQWESLECLACRNGVDVSVVESCCSDAPHRGCNDIDYEVVVRRGALSDYSLDRPLKYQWVGSTCQHFDYVPSECCSSSGTPDRCDPYKGDYRVMVVDAIAQDFRLVQQPTLYEWDNGACRQTSYQCCTADTVACQGCQMGLVSPSEPRFDLQTPGFKEISQANSACNTVTATRKASKEQCAQMCFEYKNDGRGFEKLLCTHFDWKQGNKCRFCDGTETTSNSKQAQKRKVFQLQLNLFLPQVAILPVQEEFDVIAASP